MIRGLHERGGGPTLSGVGEPSTEITPAIWALAWDKGAGTSELHTLAEIRVAYARRGTRLWIDVHAPDHELLAELGQLLDLHPLVVEDIHESNQRAKVELTGDVLHLVMFALEYAGELVSFEYDIAVGERFLLTSHGPEGKCPRAAPFRRRDASAHLSGGTDYTLWALCDWLVDGYFPVFDRFGDEIDGLEEDIMAKPSNLLVQRLFIIRRELVTIRHAVNPQREIFNQLTNRDLRLIRPERVIYFRDVYDHLIRLTDELESYRELVSATLDIYLSQVNNNLSEIMKRLTAVTVILAGVGALAGIFGMSEATLALNLRESPAFWAVAFSVLSLGGVAVIYFRRIGWI